MDFFNSYSEGETQTLGAEFAQRLQTGDVVCLNGELGSGKSVFARGIARGIGITDDVTSPTFTLINEYYSGKIPLYHIDAYRLDGSADLGLEEYFSSDGVCVIEWSQNITGVLPENYYNITIERDLDVGDEYRRIGIEHTCG